MKKLLAILLTVAMILALSAFAEEGAEDHTYDVDYWATLSPEDPVTWNAPHDYKRIGMVVPTGTDEFYVAMAKAAGEIFEREGYEFVWTGANDAQAVITAIDTWVGQGLDALVLLVQDTACEDAALRAMEQGVLVVLGSSQLASYHVWCCQEYYTIGYDIAKMAVPQIKEKFGEDASYIVMGNTSVEFMTQKTNGLVDGMKELLPNGTAYVINNSGDPQGDIETTLTQHPEIKALVTWHNNYSIPAMAALNTLGMNDPDSFMVFGSQMTEQTLMYISDTSNAYVADTWMGDQGRQYVNVVLNLLNGESVNHWDYASDFVVSAENADTYYEDYYKEFGDTYKY